jgi:hypothetical protein
MTMLRTVCPMPQNTGACRRQAGMGYGSCSHGQLGSNSSKNRIEWSRHRTHAGESRVQIAFKMEKHPQLEPHTQKLLGPVEIACCEEWCVRQPLGICRQQIKTSPDSSSSEQSEWCANWNPQSIMRQVYWTISLHPQSCHPTREAGQWPV